MTTTAELLTRVGHDYLLGGGRERRNVLKTSINSSATTIGVTAVDPSRSSLAGGIIYMFQVAGGSVGLALTTTLFASASGLIDGLHVAFRFNAIAAMVGFLIILFVVGPRVKPTPEAKTAE